MIRIKVTIIFAIKIVITKIVNNNKNCGNNNFTSIFINILCCSFTCNPRWELEEIKSFNFSFNRRYKYRIGDVKMNVCHYIMISKPL